MEYATLKDLNFNNRRVLLRADFNVSMDEEGDIIDDKRIEATLPTIRHMLDNGAQQIMIATHLGRPKGEVTEKLKLDNVATRLSELLGTDVKKTDDCIDIDMPPGKVVLLENLRFHKEETSKNDWERQEFAKKLADYADIYVNDAFAVCHRKHASVYDITKYLPSCAGLLVQNEVETITRTLNQPKHPFIAVMGGAKLETKIGAIKGLLGKVDKILLGGAMVFTFFKAEGLEIGKSLYDEGELNTAKKLLKEAEGKIILPTDIICAEEKDEESPSDVYKARNIPEDMIGLDIGPDTINAFKDIIRKAKTIVWNGPLGLYEIEKFSIGTFEIAKAIAASEATSVCGGGETDDVINRLGLSKRFSHVSTGGGASLKMLEGEDLEGIKALSKNRSEFRL